MKATVDGRPWDRDMSIKWKGVEKGTVRSQRCKGSNRSENPNCAFKQQHGKANTAQFEKNRDGHMVCKGCGRCAVFVSCLCRKYMEFLPHPLEVRVYHVGMHTCQAKRKVPLPTVVEQSLRRNPKLKPSQVVRQSILEGLKADVVDWDQLERTTDALLDTKKISNLKAKIKETNPASHSFKAVANLKLKSDEKDEYFIYKMNDRRMNPAEPSYVFKTSKLKINIALSMADKKHFMANEYCYIDGKWNRCKDFPTVTLSVYHPVLRKQVPLFIMECEEQTAESCAKFFQLVNKSIAKVAPGRVFDPVAGFMASEAGGLQEGLRRVFGNSVLEKLKTCEFHFLQCAK